MFRRGPNGGWHHTGAFGCSETAGPTVGSAGKRAPIPDDARTECWGGARSGAVYDKRAEAYELPTAPTSPEEALRKFLLRKRGSEQELYMETNYERHDTKKVERNEASTSADDDARFIGFRSYGSIFSIIIVHSRGTRGGWLVGSEEGC